MQPHELPDTTYTTTWSRGRGEVRFFTRRDGSRLRYYTAGTGPPLVLTHTVRTQLDYFQRVIPLLWDHYTVYALDLPGMGWSDIVPGAQYEEPELRAAVVEFVSGLNLHGVTLAGESLGAALALSASIDLKGRVNRVVAFNSYDYPDGLERGNWLARFIIMSVRLPGLGPAFANLEPLPIMRAVLHGGFVDKTKLPEDFLVELLRSGRPRVTQGWPERSTAALRDSTARGTAIQKCQRRSLWFTATATGLCPPSEIRWQARWRMFNGSPWPAPATSPRWSALTT